MLEEKKEQTNGRYGINAEPCTYLALIAHKRTQMRSFVPRRGSGVNDNAPRVYRWSKHDGRETRSLILEDETTIRIFGGICEPRLRRE